MNRGLQTVVAIALVSAATFGIYALVSCKHPTAFHQVRDQKNDNTRAPVPNQQVDTTGLSDVRNLGPAAGDGSGIRPHEPTTFIGHNYSTTFPFAENPISGGGVWIGGGTAGNGCAGKPCWGNMQTTPGEAFGVSEPTKYGDPTAITTGTWGANQTVQGTVVVASPQPLRGCCHELELRLRTTISDNTITGYEVYCSLIVGDPYCHIASWGGPNGSYVNLDECLGGGHAQDLKDGDVLKATIAGINPVTVTAYINGIQIMRLLDAGNCIFSDGKKHGPWASGNPGIGQYDSRDSDFRSFGWSSFSATDDSMSPPAGRAQLASGGRR